MAKRTLADGHIARLRRQDRHPLERQLLTVIAVFVAVLGLKAGAAVWTPLAAAMVLSVALWPGMRRLVRSGWPLSAVITTSMLVIAVVGLGLIGLFSYAYLRIEADLPSLLHAWEARSQMLGLDADGLRDWLKPELLRQWGRQTFESGTHVVRNLMIMMFLVVLMQAEAFRIAHRLQGPVWTRRAVAWSTGAHDVRKFLAVRSLTGLLAGALVWVLLTGAGVPYALVWGLLNVVARFIPYLGPTLIMVPPVVLALVSAGLPWASMVLTGLIFINGLIDWFLTPRMIQGQVHLPGILALFSIVFWSWALGPMGALVGVPLTLLLRAELLAGPDGRWLRPFLSTLPLEASPAGRHAARRVLNTRHQAERGGSPPSRR